MDTCPSVPATEAALSKLTTRELDAEIWHCALRARIATDAMLRRSFEKRIQRLQRVRSSRS